MTDPRIERLTEMVAALRQEGYNRQESIELLYGRIEALEAAQPEYQWHLLSEREPQGGDRCIYCFHPNLVHAYGTWSSVSKAFWGDVRGVFVGDPERISWRLARPHEISPQPQPDHLPDATEMVNTGWRNLHDLSPIMEPAPTRPDPPAPAGGLVKRVAHLLAMRFSESRPGADCTPFACDVLREVAAATDQMATDRNLTWERVALWLEREANQ